MKGKIIQNQPQQRLRDARKKLGLTLERFGKGIGVSNQTISSWENGKAPIPLMAAMSIEKAYGISEHWLTSGKGDMFVISGSKGETIYLKTIDTRTEWKEGHELEGEAIYNTLKFPRIPILTTQSTKAASRETTIYESTSDDDEFLRLSILWLDAYVGSNNLALFVVKDDSMEPTLKKNDVGLIDKSAVMSPGLWLLLDGGALMVRRIHRVSNNGDSVEVVSDNQLYPPFKPDIFGLIGRVVWVLKAV